MRALSHGSLLNPKSRRRKREMQLHSYYPPFSSPSSSSVPSTHFFRPLISKPHLFFFFTSKPQTRKPINLPFSSNSPFDSNFSEAQPLDLKPKPNPKPVVGPKPEEPTTSSEEFSDALAPFLKFFKSRDPDSDYESDPPPQTQPREEVASNVGLGLDYYDPKPGDFAVGVVVSGNENKLDVNVGADMLGTMLTKEVMPMYEKEVDYLLCDLGNEGEREGLRGRKKGGKMGIAKDDEAFEREKVRGRPVVEAGTVVFAEVMGRTLSGRPLLSSRRMYRRVAWHRVRQVLFSLLN